MDVELSADDELVKTSGYGGVQYSSVRKVIDKIQVGDILLDLATNKIVKVIPQNSSRIEDVKQIGDFKW